MSTAEAALGCGRWSISSALARTPQPSDTPWSVRWWHTCCRQP